MDIESDEKSSDSSHSEYEEGTQDDIPQDAIPPWGRIVQLPSPCGIVIPSVEFGEKDSYTIGRSSLCDVTINHKAVSSLHCTIFRHPTKHETYLQDQSSNGTFIEGQLVRKSTQPLLNGAFVTLVKKSKKHQRSKVAFNFYVCRDLTVEDEVLQRFEIEKELGKGAYGTVRLGYEIKTGMQFAIKSIDKAKWVQSSYSYARSDVSLLDEVKIMGSLNHPNVCKIHDVFEGGREWHFVMDYCKGGDMLQYIQRHGPYNQCRARRIFAQLNSAVEYLHEREIVHRDLKPENILLVDAHSDKIKLADFGASRVAERSIACFTVIGTPDYQAPEVGRQRYGRQADVWSMGVILYVMLAATKLTKTPDELWWLSQNKVIPFPAAIWGDKSPSVLDLICNMLVYDPSERYRPEQIKRHAWMRKQFTQCIGDDYETKEPDQTVPRVRRNRTICTDSLSQDVSHQIGRKRRREPEETPVAKRHRVQRRMSLPY